MKYIPNDDDDDGIDPVYIIKYLTERTEEKKNDMRMPKQKQKVREIWEGGVKYRLLVRLSIVASIGSVRPDNSSQR